MTKFLKRYPEFKEDGWFNVDIRLGAEVIAKRTFCWEEEQLMKIMKNFIRKDFHMKQLKDITKTYDDMFKHSISKVKVKDALKFFEDNGFLVGTDNFHYKKKLKELELDETT